MLSAGTKRSKKERIVKRWERKGAILLASTLTPVCELACRELSFLGWNIDARTLSLRAGRRAIPPTVSCQLANYNVYGNGNKVRSDDARFRMLPDEELMRTRAAA